MRKPKPNLFEHLEKARQQQVALMARFTQAQAHITQIEERLQALHIQRQNQEASGQSASLPSADTFLPANGDLELAGSFPVQSSEEQETERLVPLHISQSSSETAPEQEQGEMPAQVTPDGQEQA